MELQYNEVENNIKVLRLIGRLDIIGVGAIETKFAAYCSGEKPCVIVDLSEVDFLASIGIRLLTTNAKTVASRGGKMVMLNPQSDVKDVLEITGIPAIIPMYEDLKSAESALKA